MRSSDMRDSLVCPKPRRLALINTSFDEEISPIRWQIRNKHESEFSDSDIGNELLDIILSRGAYTVEQTCTQTASSSPFFCGSLPSRVSNPLTQDARFGDEVAHMTIPLQDGMPVSPSSSTRKGACVQVSNIPIVRIEGGFDCFDRDSLSCNIPTMA
ncbi:hypothetical protein DCAR_0727135 [Daucus carota subsp. sativus]|uniref:Uncharacterized protein n=1 Tax=Daucus carota subsp. sativus TaxID=79200 RepID=A0A161X2F0_DAUCS|nr:PREDICTED: uncharacterized protein LOC108195366 [Daucus carota subsp. sativus]WOH07702.1 hypothetical protein DCAR_0727135 [Daucus carota subsp. sativus]